MLKTGEMTLPRFVWLRQKERCGERYRLTTKRLRLAPSEFSSLTFVSPCLFSCFSVTLTKKLLTGNSQH
ncbi:hypothetical protein, partial [Pantoea latae]|uniref:hypothetical protein n=1 Tax=Pantoea latae TaxID=1964541 RepID=UPI001F22EFBE